MNHFVIELRPPALRHDRTDRFAQVKDLFRKNFKVVDESIAQLRDLRKVTPADLDKAFDK